MVTNIIICALRVQAHEHMHTHAAREPHARMPHESHTHATKKLFESLIMRSRISRIRVCVCVCVCVCLCVCICLQGRRYYTPDCSVVAARLDRTSGVSARQKIGLWPISLKRHSRARYDDCLRLSFSCASNNMNIRTNSTQTR